jgi:dienelactone hydrolase
VNDVRVALRELAQRSESRRLVCVGARLGAAAAIRAASGFGDLARLVLWDPIVQGADYLESLRVKHVESLESSYSIADPAWRQRLADDPQAYTDEAIGFGMSALLRQQIRKLGPHSLALPPGVEVNVVSRPDDAPVTAWFAPHAQEALRRLRPLAYSFDWTAEESRNSPLVPPQALAVMMEAIRD